MEKILKQMNPWWIGEYNPPGILREALLRSLLPLVSVKDIIIIKGLRRAGKTTLMLQAIDRLIRDGMNPKRILYVSVDNLSLKDHSIGEIVEGFRAINELTYDTQVTLFLDEVHTSKEWELELKNLYDMGFSKVIASGSQSLDITMRTSNLVGRHRFFDVYPLDFNEYSKFREKPIRIEDQHLIPVLINEYLLDGGIPEYVLSRDINYLSATVESILFREIVQKANIRNRENLVDILKMIARNCGSPLSIRKIARTLSISPGTVHNIVVLLKEATLLCSVERSGKFSERKTAPVKMYLADNGLFNVLAEDINRGILAENMVAVHLFRSGRLYYTTVGNREVDFIQGDDAFEVKYKGNITDRDIKGLADLNIGGRKVLITYDREGMIGNIEMIPLWKFIYKKEKDLFSRKKNGINIK